MPELKDILGVIAALIGVVSAWIAYKAKAREGALRAPSRAQVLMIDDKSIDTSYGNVKRLFRLSLYINVSVVVLLLVLFTLAGVLSDLIWIAIIYVPLALLPLIMMKLLRTEPPSRIMKSARIKLKGSASEVLQQALTAMQTTGTEVARFDAVEHAIKGRRKSSVWLQPSIIQVTVTALTEDTSEIEVSSDAIMPSAVFDFGQNRKNVQGIVNFMLGNNVSA